MARATETSYFITEGLIGEDSIWRVVREELDEHGGRLLAFVACCQTRRAAMSLARALNEKRDVDLPTLAAAERRRPRLEVVHEPPPLDAYRMRPSC